MVWDRGEERELGGLRKAVRGDRVHAEREDQRPVLRVVLQWDTAHDVAHDAQDDSSGIHQVAVAQKNSVKPSRNGEQHEHRRVRACTDSVEPASVAIATAPMLIQYGGVRRSIVSSKNVKR